MHQTQFSEWHPELNATRLKPPFPLLQGYDQDGVDDLVSGVLMGAYHSGGGGGPLIGGACKHGLGFPWSGAVFAAVFAAQGVAIAVLATVMPPEPKYDAGMYEKLPPISGEPASPRVGGWLYKPHCYTIHLAMCCKLQASLQAP